MKNARKAFFSFGSVGAFHGQLNPLPGRSIFENCVILIALYGCELWYLTEQSIDTLERFQNEIGNRILRLPKFFSGKTTWFGLDMPSTVAWILICKLLYLYRLLTTQYDNVAARIVTTLTCIDSTEMAIV